MLDACIALKAAVLGRKPVDTTSGIVLPGVMPPLRIGDALPPVAEETAEWTDPPHDFSSQDVASVYELGSKPARFDVDLLESLNEEYLERRVVSNAPKYDGRSLASATERRVKWVHNTIDLREKRLLEIGCGFGAETWAAAHNLGADAHGVDVTERASWAQLRGDRVDLRMTDLGVENPFPENHFDRIMSFAVWEHVAHPYALLEQAYRVLRPGGLAWLRVNLYPGPQASHRYRYIFFPWPHLLFSDDVVREWDAKHGRTTDEFIDGFAWVNRLTWDGYQAHFARLGFIVRRVTFDRIHPDLDFYKRFEATLGRYKMWDLCTDYFNVVLEKPGG